ncbi:MAG: RlmE family RNA methyltransferase [Candidatus Thermoplasmatota archaeon]|nr:RlmE family RNA methyltransferase [Candidatus Thermoplasmatota archaeon]
MADRWADSHRRDSWRKMAKNSGYRARSAFKLIQIQKKFNLIREGDNVLDVGSHPGGWSQVSVEFEGNGGYVVGVDLEPCEPVDGCLFIVGDITDLETQKRTIEAFSDSMINTVVSDISPNLTGNWSRDQIISLQLVASVFDFSLPLLCPGGNFVTKIFQGEGIEKLIQLVKPRFSSVKRYSPEASRNSSSEVYLICKNHVPWKNTGTSILSELNKIYDSEEEEEEVTEKSAIGFRLHKAK